MTETTFIKELADVLAEDPSAMDSETALESLAGWDSMGKVATISFLDSAFGVRLPRNDPEVPPGTGFGGPR